jgi:hypothetical protein
MNFVDWLNPVGKAVGQAAGLEAYLLEPVQHKESGPAPWRW